MKRFNSKGTNSASSSQKRLRKTPIVPLTTSLEDTKEKDAASDKKIVDDIIDLDESINEQSKMVHNRKNSLATEIPPTKDLTTRDLEATHKNSTTLIANSSIELVGAE